MFGKSGGGSQAEDPVVLAGCWLYHDGPPSRSLRPSIKKAILGLIVDHWSFTWMNVT